MEHIRESGAEYILRYHLPMQPYADAPRTQRRFEELLAFCRATGTRAVMLYVAFHAE